MGKLFGTDGIRGIANIELTCELASSVGKALATVLKNTAKTKVTVIVGCDTRRSSDMLCASIIGGLCSAGASVEYVGCVPTPAVAYLTRHHSANAGIMVSASHNPAEYNGIKIFSSTGIKLPDHLEEEIERMLASPPTSLPPSGIDIGKVSNHKEAYLTEYCDYLKNTVDQRLDGIRIAIDCANGSASVSAQRIFTELGATVQLLSASPNGDNINQECGSTHLESLKNHIKAHKFDIGFAFDGDADRCICVDSNGNEIDGDRIIAMCAIDMKKQGRLKNNTVVGTVMSNLGLIHFCQKNGIKFIATKVGDRFVLEEMLRGDYSLGGEQSGHIIFRDCSTTGDGQLTALQVLSLIKRYDRSIVDLASEMTVYPQITVNIHADHDGKSRLTTDSNISAIIKEASEALGDNGRLLVRASGTEPLIRIMAEGTNEGLIKQIVSDVANKLHLTLNSH